MMRTIKMTKSQYNKKVKEYKQQLTTQASNYFMHNKDEDVEIKNEKARPQIYFSDECYKHICALVAACKDEIAWNCRVTRDGLTFTLEECYVFPQIVTGVSVDVDPTEYAMWVAGLDDDTVNNMRAHCHSHVNMGVTPSGIDWDYQKQMVEGNIRDYYLFLIFNKKGAVSANIYDIEANALYTDKDIDIHTPDKLYEEWAEKIIEERIKKPKPVTYSTKVIGVPTNVNSDTIDKAAAAARGKKAQESYRQMKLDEINAAKRQQILDDDDDDHYWNAQNQAMYGRQWYEGY